jgi:hypothetical protein
VRDIYIKTLYIQQQARTEERQQAVYLSEIKNIIVINVKYNKNQQNLPWNKKRLALKADNLTAIYESQFSSKCGNFNNELMVLRGLFQG